jgi:hypothetical protein
MKGEILMGGIHKEKGRENQGGKGGQNRNFGVDS